MSILIFSKFGISKRFFNVNEGKGLFPAALKNEK